MQPEILLPVSRLGWLYCDKPRKWKHVICFNPKRLISSQDMIFPVINYLFSFLIPLVNFFFYQSTNLKNAMTKQGDLAAAMHQTSFVDHSQVTALLVSHACFGDKWQPQPFVFQATQVYHLGNTENNSVLLSRVPILKFETIFKQSLIQPENSLAKGLRCLRHLNQFNIQYYQIIKR